MGILVDLTRCNGCRRCEAACNEAAGFEVPTAESLLDESVFAQHRRPGPRGYTIVNKYAGPGNGPQDEPVYVKLNCMHCLDPACVSACLVGAMQREPNGAVTYDAQKCMGCRYCMVACPFQMPAYEYDNVFTPQVRKCTFCSNEGNPHKGGTPACVAACPRECLSYGKRSTLLAQARATIAESPDLYLEHIYGEHEAGGTSWLYVSAVPFTELGFLNVDPQAPPRLAETIQHGVFHRFIPPVAWCGILGLAAWLTRPEATAASSDPHAPDESPSAASAQPDATVAPVREGVLP
jgi:Fe-S-cluster-containing dehydrogenase component